MKRFLSILLTLFVCASFVFADDSDEGDEYDDGYVYERNGAGDQLLKVNLGSFFPLNFGGAVRKGEEYTGGKLYPGGVAEVGYFRFMNKWFALGGEFSASYNLSIGKKTLVTIPVTVGALVQPSIGNFEFPVTLQIGMGFESWQNLTLFPAFIGKATAGVYYRINESFSIGGNGSFYWMPQWFKDSEKNYNGLFTGVTITGRYHF